MHSTEQSKTQTPTPTREILIKARELISKPENWTTGAYARRSDHSVTGSYDPLAIRWCSTGAINRVMRSFETMENDPAEFLSSFMSGEGIENFNDSHTHQEVLDVFDKAIAFCSV